MARGTSGNVASQWRRTHRLVLACVVLASGCIGPRETQFLSWCPRRPDVEARSWDWHDPFPDERIGPETATRPRQFVEPRTDTRKDYDQRFLLSMHPTAGTQLAPGPAWRGYAQPGIVSNGGYPPVYAPVVNPSPVAVSPTVPAY